MCPKSRKELASADDWPKFEALLDSASTSEIRETSFSNRFGGPVPGSRWSERGMRAASLLARHPHVAKRVNSPSSRPICRRSLTRFYSSWGGRGSTSACTARSVSVTILGSRPGGNQARRRQACGRAKHPDAHWFLRAQVTFTSVTCAASPIWGVRHHFSPRNLSQLRAWVSMTQAGIGRFVAFSGGAHLRKF